MGLALAAVIKGYKCIFTTTDKQSKEKVDILKAVGAEVIVCPTNVLPEDPRSYYSVSARLAREIRTAFTSISTTTSPTATHIMSRPGPRYGNRPGKITHLVVATGTGGTITGTGKYLKEQNPDVQIWAVDSYGSLLKKYFDTGEIDMTEVYPYITEGIGEDFVPKNYDMSVIDYFEKVSDKDGAVMARRISKEEGIFVGYSAGSAVAGLLQLKTRLKADDVVVVIFHDHGSRYVGKVYNDQWMMERGFLDVKTVRDVVNGRRNLPLVTISPEEKVSDAIGKMKKFDIEHLPVLKDREMIGALSEGGFSTNSSTSRS